MSSSPSAGRAGSALAEQTARVDEHALELLLGGVRDIHRALEHTIITQSQAIELIIGLVDGAPLGTRAALVERLQHSPDALDRLAAALYARRQA